MTRSASLLTVFFIVIIGVFFYLKPELLSESDADLKILTYDTFPKKPFTQLFQSKCNCKITFTPVSSAATLLNRFQYTDNDSDVIIGLNFSMIQKPSTKKLFQPIDSSNIAYSDLAKNFSFPKFLPFDYSPVGFIAKNQFNAPNFKNTPGEKLTVPNPTTSLTGSYFLHWLRLRNVDWKNPKLPKNIGFTDSWATSFSLYDSGKAEVFFTFLTSLTSYPSDKLVFNNQPLPIYWEYAGINVKSKNKKLAKKFVHFLLSDKAQLILTEKNYMLSPVIGINEKSIHSSLPSVQIEDDLQFYTNIEQNKKKMLFQFNRWMND